MLIRVIEKFAQRCWSCVLSLKQPASQRSQVFLSFLPSTHLSMVRAALWTVFHWPILTRFLMFLHFRICFFQRFSELICKLQRHHDQGGHPDTGVYKRQVCFLYKLCVCQSGKTRSKAGENYNESALPPFKIKLLFPDCFLCLHWKSEISNPKKTVAVWWR